MLVKPQFEAGREEVGKGGVVRDPEVHRRVVDEVAAQAADWGARVEGTATRACPARRETVSSSSTSAPPSVPDKVDLRARSSPTAARSDRGRESRVRELATEAGVELTSLDEGSPDLVVALGGDGTMLRALRPLSEPRPRSSA